MNKKERHEVPSYTGIVPLHVLADWNCMRRALIACIHGNLIALETVLKDIALEGVDEIVCLGDMVGYGPDALECVDLVRSECAFSLCGNHDYYLFTDSVIAIHQILKSGLSRDRKLLQPTWFKGQESKTRWEWIKELKPHVSYGGACLVHGSIRNPLFEHPSEEDFLLVNGSQGIMAREIFNFDEPICFCAHTHRPGIVAQGKEWQRPEALESSRASLDSSVKYMVNVGSVGQPRDRDPRSCYVIWDDVDRTVTFHRIPYDIDAAIKRFQSVEEIGKKHGDRLRLGV